MPYQREAEIVLARWREVERELKALDPLSDDAARLTDDWARLRAEYQVLLDRARQHHPPEPTAGPEREAVEHR
jgi:hypothetical protein